MQGFSVVELMPVNQRKHLLLLLNKLPIMIMTGDE